MVNVSPNVGLTRGPLVGGGWLGALGAGVPFALREQVVSRRLAVRRPPQEDVPEGAPKIEIGKKQILQQF